MLIVSFGVLEEIEEGDTLTVYECGRAEDPGAADESYDVFVGVSTEPTASWVRCMEVEGTQSCDVPRLPPIPSE